MRSELIAVVLVVAGCAHSSRTIMTPRREANLYERAGRALSCSRADMTMDFVTSIDKDFHLYRVKGCGAEYEAIMACRVGHHGKSHCSWLETPERQAAVILGCPAPSPIQREYRGNFAFSVSGCGKTATVVNASGQWLVEGAPGPASPSPAAESDEE